MLFPVVEGIVAVSEGRFRRRRRKRIAAAIATMMIATTKKTPPTAALFDQKPLLVALATVAMVVATACGAVGVTVKVSTCPVTVITDINGVGVHVLLIDEVVILDVVGDVIGVGVGVGVLEVLGVVGLIEVEVDGVGGTIVVVDVGIIRGVGVILVLVDVVEGV